jgi:UDP:flavonoid glycosyltransferase YjiC (YdhE family)
LNILLVSIGSLGDVHPFVGVGQALRERGHCVTLLANDCYAHLARRAGFDFTSLGSQAEQAALYSDPEMWHPRRGFGVFARRMLVPMIRRVYQAIERLRGPESIVVASGQCFGARIAHEKLDIPLVTLAYSPSFIRSVHESSLIPGFYLPRWLPHALKRWQYKWLDTAILDPMLANETNALRSELGLPPVRRIMGGWHLSPTRILAMFPGWFARPQPDWPRHTTLAGFSRYDGQDLAPPADRLVKFLDAGEPPIVFTLGSAMSHGARFFSAAIDACQRLGMRGVFVTHADQCPGELPPNILRLEYAPFSWLLPRSAAIVHHGGIGTISHAFAAGVPQIFMPLAYDQFDNSARAARLGVGRTLTPTSLQGPRVADELRKLLSSSRVADRCRAVADKMHSEDGDQRACETIERLIHEPSSRYAYAAEDA